MTDPRGAGPRLWGLPAPTARDQPRGVTELPIADESVLWREGLAAVLGQEGMAVVDKLCSAATLRLALGETSPDVVLVGIPMPAVGPERGMSVIESMRLEDPSGVGVLVLSAHFDLALAVRLIGRRPVRTGYLLKQPLPDVETLVRAVGVVAGGGTFVDRSVIERLRSTRSRPESLQCLSERERGILALIAEGRTNSAICDKFCLSPKTVETHVRAIFNKLDLRAAPEDHRRVLAVLCYLEANGEEQRPDSLRASGESTRPTAGGEVRRVRAAPSQGYP